MEHIPQNLIKCLLFAVGNSFFAIEVSNVLGIIQADGITVIPYVEPFILGVTKLRGEICTVIDLRTRLLGKAPLWQTGLTGNFN